MAVSVEQQAQSGKGKADGGKRRAANDKRMAASKQASAPTPYPFPLTGAQRPFASRLPDRSDRAKKPKTKVDALDC